MLYAAYSGTARVKTTRWQYYLICTHGSIAAFPDQCKGNTQVLERDHI